MVTPFSCAMNGNEESTSMHQHIARAPTKGPRAIPRALCGVCVHEVTPVSRKYADDPRREHAIWKGYREPDRNTWVLMALLDLHVDPVWFGESNPFVDDFHHRNDPNGTN